MADYFCIGHIRTAGQAFEPLQFAGCSGIDTGTL